MKEIATTAVKVKVSQAVNQDAASILITRHDEDGKNFYVKEFVWTEYRPYDVLDISNVSTNVPITVEAPTQRIT